MYDVFWNVDGYSADRSGISFSKLSAHRESDAGVEREHLSRDLELASGLLCDVPQNGRRLVCYSLPLIASARAWARGLRRSL